MSFWLSQIVPGPRSTLPESSAEGWPTPKFHVAALSIDLPSRGYHIITLGSICTCLRARCSLRRIAYPLLGSVYREEGG